MNSERAQNTVLTPQIGYRDRSKLRGLKPNLSSQLTCTAPKHITINIFQRNTIIKITKRFIISAIICYTVANMETEQLNIRVSQELINDLDIVSGLLKINRSEWIKTKLAEEAHREKNRLLMELSTLYAKGMITKQNVEELVGKEIAEEMESIKEAAVESIKMGREYGRKLKQRLAHN